MQTAARRFAGIAWPAFLAAAVLEIIVFAFVDPASLHWPGGASVELSATTVYSVAFFVFWIVVAVAGAMTQRLEESAYEVNSRGFRK